MAAAPTVLAVIPHPDDEVYPFGGALALAARAGARVHVAALTRGDAGQDRATGL
ncbi:MAG: PIG-L family deacetylase, partial [Myxococcales bacterium]|nr:PIG-L family deacetylase [Myxococcales bacterium]